jgi:hypothetical protein
MNYNILISTFIFACCLFYIKYNETFYRFCITNSVFEKINDETRKNSFPFELSESPSFLKRLERLEKYCHDANIRYESHTIMRLTINKINQFILSSEPLDKELFEMFVIRSDPTNLKLALWVLKFIHIGLYISVLYIGIIVVPNYLAQLALSLVNKLLLFIFFILLGEAVLKIYFNWEMDFIKFVDKQVYLSYVDYLPFGTIGSIIKYIVDLIKNLF